MKLSRPRSILLRTGAVAIVLLGSFIGSPVQAAGSADVWFSSNIVIGGAGSPGKSFVATYGVYGATTRALARFDFSGMAGLADVTITGRSPVSCTAGPDVTCELPLSAYDSLAVVLTPKAGAKAGDTAAFTYWSVADGVAGSPKTGTVTVADGFDLVMQKSSDAPGGLRPGAVLPVPMVMGNVGNRVISGVAVRLTLSPGLRPTQYSGCGYAGNQVICVLADLVVKPGEYFKIVDAEGKEFSATVMPYGLGSQYAIVSAEPAEIAADLPGAPTMKPGSGKALTAVKVPSQAAARLAADIDIKNNSFSYDWYVKNDKEIAAVGAAVTARTGEEITIKVGARNDGPATLPSMAGVPVVRFNVLLPPGLQLISAPPTCTPWINGGFSGVPSRKEYWCDGSATELAVGDSDLLSFRVKVLVSSGTAGTVTLNKPDFPYKDDNPIDDFAPISLTISEPEPSDSPAATPAPGGPAGPSSGPVAGGGGTLPVTGTQITLIAGGGVALAGAGAVLFLLARRRRISLADEA